MQSHQLKIASLPVFPLSPKNNRCWIKTKKALNFFSAFAPAGIELLNLWNDFQKVVKFIDDNATWLRPLLDKMASNKKAEEK